MHDSNGSLGEVLKKTGVCVAFLLRNFEFQFLVFLKKVGNHSAARGDEGSNHSAAYGDERDNDIISHKSRAIVYPCRCTTALRRLGTASPVSRNSHISGRFARSCFCRSPAASGSLLEQ